MVMADRPDIETLGQHLAYQNAWTRVREDRIRRRDGSEGIYGVVEKPDFVVVAALEDGYLHLVEQFRYPVGARFWELPQGAVRDSDRIDSETMARTELREETGVTTEIMECVGRLFPCYGLSAHAFDVFLASGLTEGEPAREIEEQDMISRRFALDDVLEMVRDGTIRDGVSVAALGLLQLHGRI